MAPPDPILDIDEWQGVGPALTSLRRLLGLAPLALVAMVAAIVAVVGNGTVTRVVATVIVVLAAAVAFWIWRWAERSRLAIGFAESRDDFVVRSGILRRRLVVVPYGRMQFVDVVSGPLEQSFGVYTVTLHTASPQTAATIPGLRHDQAEHLRDRLTTLGRLDEAGV